MSGAGGERSGPASDLLCDPTLISVNVTFTITAKAAGGGRERSERRAVRPSVRPARRSPCTILLLYN